VGFGLVLAAFGSKASGSWAGWTITGSGAMAIVLFLVLQHYASSTYYKKGKLHGDLSQVADLAIIDANPLYTYRDKNTRSIEFIILSKKLQSKQMMIQIYTTEKEAGKEFFEMIGDTKNIYDNYLSNDNDTDNFIQWQLDYAARTVKDGSKVIFQEPESIRENVPHELHSGLGLSLQGINFIRDARAGEMIGQSAMKAEILWIS